METAQAKRQQARQQKVDDGIYELLLWMKDIVRNGPCQLPEKSTSYWEIMARRMVRCTDARIGWYGTRTFRDQFLQRGLAAPIHGSVPAHLSRAAGLRVKEQALPELFTAGTSFTGWLHAKSQEALTTTNRRTKDAWLILNKQSTEEDNLTTEKYWLYGLHFLSNRH